MLRDGYGVVALPGAITSWVAWTRLVTPELLLAPGVRFDLDTSVLALCLWGPAFTLAWVAREHGKNERDRWEKLSTADLALSLVLGGAAYSFYGFVFAAPFALMFDIPAGWMCRRLFLNLLKIIKIRFDHLFSSH